MFVVFLSPCISQAASFKKFVYDISPGLALENLEFC